MQYNKRQEQKSKLGGGSPPQESHSKLAKALRSPTEPAAEQGDPGPRPQAQDRSQVPGIGGHSREAGVSMGHGQLHASM